MKTKFVGSGASYWILYHLFIPKVEINMTIWHRFFQERKKIMFLMQITHSEEIASKNFSTEREKKNLWNVNIKIWKLDFFIHVHVRYEICTFQPTKKNSNIYELWKHKIHIRCSYKSLILEVFSCFELFSTHMLWFCVCFEVDSHLKMRPLRKRLFESLRSFLWARMLDYIVPNRIFNGLICFSKFWH